MGKVKKEYFKAQQYATYKDDDSRVNFLKFAHKQPDFRKYLADVFNLHGKNIRIIDGVEFDVDMYVVDPVNNSLYGLIELEMKRHWKQRWTEHESYIHHLPRKLKYLRDDTPYLQVVSNLTYDKVFTYTGDVVRKYCDENIGPIEKRNRDGVYDSYYEIPLKELKIFGNWDDLDIMYFRSL